VWGPPRLHKEGFGGGKGEIETYTPAERSAEDDPDQAPKESLGGGGGGLGGGERQMRSREERRGGGWGGGETNAQQRGAPRRGVGGERDICAAERSAEDDAGQAPDDRWKALFGKTNEAAERDDRAVKVNRQRQLPECACMHVSVCVCVCV
jgi:hypothetical protein